MPRNRSRSPRKYSSSSSSSKHKERELDFKDFLGFLSEYKPENDNQGLNLKIQYSKRLRGISNSNIKGILCILKEMVAFGIYPDKFIFSQLITKLGFEKGKAIFLIAKDRCKHDPEAVKIFNKNMAFAYATHMKPLYRRGSIQQIETLFDEAIRHGVADKIFLRCELAKLQSASQYDLAYQLFQRHKNLAGPECYNIILDCLGKSRNFSALELVFSEMKSIPHMIDAVSFHTVINCYLRADNTNRAFAVYQDFLVTSPPTVQDQASVQELWIAYYSSKISEASDVSQAFLFYEEANKLGIINIFHHSLVHPLLMRANKDKQAKAIFEKLKERNLLCIATYNVMINLFEDDLDYVFALFHEARTIQPHRIKPDQITYSSVMKVVVRCQDESKVTELYEDADGLSHWSFGTFGEVIQFWIDKKKIEKAIDVLTQAIAHHRDDKISYTAVLSVISALEHERHLPKGCQFFESVFTRASQEKSPKAADRLMDFSSFNAGIKCLILNQQLNRAFELFNYAITRRPHWVSRELYESILMGLSHSSHQSDWEMGLKIFNKIYHKKNIHTSYLFNNAILCALKLKQYDQANKILEKAINHNEDNEITYSTVFSLLSQCEDASQLQQRLLFNRATERAFERPNGECIGNLAFFLAVKCAAKMENFVKILHILFCVRKSNLDSAQHYERVLFVFLGKVPLDIMLNIFRIAELRGKLIPEIYTAVILAYCNEHQYEQALKFIFQQDPNINRCLFLIDTALDHKYETAQTLVTQVQAAVDEKQIDQEIFNLKLNVVKTGNTYQVNIHRFSYGVAYVLLRTFLEKESQKQQSERNSAAIYIEIIYGAGSHSQVFDTNNHFPLQAMTHRLAKDLGATQTEKPISSILKLKPITSQNGLGNALALFPKLTLASEDKLSCSTSQPLMGSNSK